MPFTLTWKGHYEGKYWCRQGSHFIDQADAVPEKSGNLRCPIHKRRVRMNARDLSRSRVYLGEGRWQVPKK